MEFKSFPIREVKTIADGAPSGTFEAIVAAYNVDDGGDRIEPGAFKNTLSQGLPPIVWSHDWGVPPIGAVESASETNDGLVIKGRLFVGEGEDSPVARQVYTAMNAKDGNGQPVLREFSFGYSVKEAGEETIDDQPIRVLKEIDLFEVGPTLIGMNRQTALLGVKQAENAIAAAVASELETEAKAGRTLSATNETKLNDGVMAIRDGVKAIQDVLATVKASPAREGGSQSDDNASHKTVEVEEGKRRITGLLLTHHIESRSK